MHRARHAVGSKSPLLERLLHILVVHLRRSGADEFDALNRSIGFDEQGHDDVAGLVCSGTDIEAGEAGRLAAAR